MDEIYVEGTDNVATLNEPAFYSVTNYHAGLNSFSFELVSMNFDKNSFNLLTAGFYNYINITVWNFRERYCSLSYPYYEDDSQLCYDVCPTGYKDSNGINKKYCAPCD